jgi:hypothetical protein
MATPVYNTSWAGGRHWGHPPGRTRGVVDRVGSWFGGSTPQYSGSGQPTPDSGSSMLGSGTPVYAPAPPPTGVTPDAATAPQANALAIVVPRT